MNNTNIHNKLNIYKLNQISKKLIFTFIFSILTNILQNIKIILIQPNNVIIIIIV